MNQKIVVTGASGRQGGAVVSGLISLNNPFCATSRSPQQKLAHLEQQGVETRQTDFDNLSSIESALEGATAAYLVTTPWEQGVEKEIQEGLNFIQACKNQNVKHIVFSSVASASDNTNVAAFESKGQLEQAIKESGLSYTILRPVFFMENFAKLHCHNQPDEKLRLPFPSDTPIQMVSIKVIGEIGSQALIHPDRFHNQTIELASDQITIQEVVDLIFQASGQKVTYQQASTSEFEQTLGSLFTDIYTWLEKTGFKVDIKQLHQRNISLPSFKEYLQQANWVKQLHDQAVPKS